MKKTIALFVFGLLAILTLNVNAQEESSWSTGADITAVMYGVASNLGMVPLSSLH
jgi:hypothetical protein